MDKNKGRVLTLLKVNGRIFNRCSQLSNCWFPELCSRGMDATVTECSLQWARRMNGPSKADAASVSSPSFRQCDPGAHGSPLNEHLTSAVLTESLGLGQYSKKAQGLQILPMIHSTAQGAPSLGAKIQSDFEGPRNNTSTNHCQPMKCLLSQQQVSCF